MDREGGGEQMSNKRYLIITQESSGFMPQVNYYESSVQRDIEYRHLKKTKEFHSCTENRTVKLESIVRANILTKEIARTVKK